MLNKIVPIVVKAERLFKEGLRIAKAAAQICIVGIYACGMMLGKLAGSIEDDLLTEVGDEPP